MRALLVALVAALALPLAAVPAAADQGDIDASWGFLGRVSVEGMTGSPVTPRGTDHTLVSVSCGESCGTLAMLGPDGRRVETFAPLGTVPFTIYRLVEVPSGILALGAGAARFTTAGQLDPTFAMAPEQDVNWWHAVQATADGPIHLGGTRNDPTAVCYGGSTVVRTVSAAGTPASTQVRLPKVGQDDSVSGLALDGGTLFVALTSTSSIGGFQCRPGNLFRSRGFVLAYGADGSPRTGFGYNGVVVMGDRTAEDAASVGVATAAGGLVTTFGSQVRVLRPTDGAGVRTIPVGLNATSVLVDGEGRYVLGDTGIRGRIAWIRPDGSPDTRFGTCGYSAVNGRPIPHRGNDVLVVQYGQSGGTILRLGGTDVPGAPHRTAAGAWTVQADGRVVTSGDGLWCGPTGSLALGAPIVGIGLAGTRNGYWIAAANGAVRAFGHAEHRGDLAGRRLNRPIVGMAASPLGDGYWLVASDGGIFSFGNAAFHGSTGAMRLNKPIVGMAPTPTGRGYWLVASDGGIFSFGDARFHGSTGNLRLASPIVGIAATSTGGGYHLLASAGGTFAFGDAVIVGNAGCRAVDIDGLPDRRARVFCADGRIWSQSFQVPGVGRPIVAGVGG